MTRAVFTVGRGPKSDAVLQHSSISRQHAEIAVEADGTIRLRDLGSTYGTFVHRGGAWQRVENEAVGPGEPVMFGKHQTTVQRVLSHIQRDGRGLITGALTDAERATRKQASVLMADVVGYSRLMAGDPDGTLGALRDCRRNLVDPTVLHHNGRIFKEAGDAILAEFRFPLEALQCANAIQCAITGRTFGRAKKALQLRIGIHHGEAISDNDDLFGDAVNIAERLQTLAPPGGICVSAFVRDDVAKRFRLASVDLGEKALKNIPYAVHVHEIPPGPIEPLAKRRRSVKL